MAASAWAVVRADTLALLRRRTGRKRGVGMLAAGVDGGEFELPRSLSQQAPAWPGQAQQQSRSILRCRNSSDCLMTYRSRPAT